MTEQFRASRSTRSGRPGGQSDQDIVDGLPIRQWRLQETVIATTADDPAANANDNPNEGAGRWVELPMPKGSTAYTPWCQQILRAARQGRIGIAARRFKGEDKDDEEEEAGVQNGGDDGKESTEESRKRKLLKTEERGFLAKRWSQLPKHQEEPEREYLAKRRKGLPSAYQTGVANAAIPMRKTRVRRLDAEGNPTIWEILVPEGQTVQGEVRSDTILENGQVAIAAPAPGTVVEGLGVANSEGVLIANESAVAPIKRKGPPPRRKPKKGPGRGHKKLSDTAGEGVSASAEALEARSRAKAAALNGLGTPLAEGTDATGTPAQQHTTGDEGEEDEGEGDGEDDDDGEDGEEGENDEDEEDDDHEEGEIVDTPDPEQPPTKVVATTQPEIQKRTSPLQIESTVGEPGSKDSDYVMIDPVVDKQAAVQPEAPMENSMKHLAQDHAPVDQRAQIDVEMQDSEPAPVVLEQTTEPAVEVDTTPEQQDMPSSDAMPTRTSHEIVPPPPEQVQVQETNTEPVHKEFTTPVVEENAITDEVKPSVESSGEAVAAPLSSVPPTVATPPLPRLATPVPEDDIFERPPPAAQIPNNSDLNPVALSRPVSNIPTVAPQETGTMPPAGPVVQSQVVSRTETLPQLDARRGPMSTDEIRVVDPPGAIGSETIQEHNMPAADSKMEEEDEEDYEPPDV